MNSTYTIHIGVIRVKKFKRILVGGAYALNPALTLHYCYVQIDSSLPNIHSHTEIVCSPLVSATDTVTT